MANAEETEQTYTLAIGIDNTTAQDVANLYTLVGWGEDCDVEDVRAALLKTGCVIRAVTAAGSTVGFVRLFGDGQYYSCVAEIVVHPDWRRRGVGTALLSKACALYAGSPLFLETFRGQEEFFTRVGFTAKERMVVMSKRRAQT